MSQKKRSQIRDTEIVDMLKTYKGMYTRPKGFLYSMTLDECIFSTDVIEMGLLIAHYWKGPNNIQQRSDHIRF